MKNRERIRKNEVLEILGETLHTAWRKGCDAPQSAEIWVLIKELPYGKWGDYIKWVVWELGEMGLSIQRRRKNV